MLAPWTKDFLGIPFLNMGRNYRGVDCWGLVILVYKRLYKKTLPLYATDFYDSRDISRVSELIEQKKEQINLFQTTDTPRKGNIVLIQRGLFIHHVGIYIGKEDGHPHILHTTRVRGHSYCERLTNKANEHARISYHKLS